MKIRFIISMLAVVALAAACEKENEETPAKTDAFPDEVLYKITKFDSQPFLGETYINDYDYDAGNDYIIDHYAQQESGACSSFRVGGYAARSADWYIKDYAMLVVHMAANKEKGRHASVAILASNPFINRAMIQSGVVSDHVEVGGKSHDNFRSIAPIFTSDGINDAGLCVNTNIVLHEDFVREGYVPNTGEEGKHKTSFISLPRYILDNCSTPDEAVTMCGNLNVTQAFSGPFSDQDSHIFVSNKDKTIILEWVNNKMVWTEFLPDGNLFKSPEGMPAIMTNFFNYFGKQHLNADGSIDLAGLLSVHPYAMGVERYETLRDGLDQVTSIAEAQAQIEKVRYTYCYDINKKWHTENCGSCKLVGDTWYYPTDKDCTPAGYMMASDIVDAIKKMYEPGGYQSHVIESFGDFDQRMQDLDKGIECNEWYSEFSDIFDINSKELHIMPQQGWYRHEYIKFTVRGNY